MTDESAIPGLIRVEIEQLHAFFCQWFTAAIAQERATYARFTQAVTSDFELISPGGVLTARTDLLERLWHAHGSRRGQPFNIWTKDLKTRPMGLDVWLATYQEWQETADGQRGRLSSAVFRPSKGAPNEVAWAHVHEVWLPDSVPTQPEPSRGSES